MTTGADNFFWKQDFQSNEFSTDLTDIQKQLRQKFVEEYLYDRDPVAAALRCGFVLQYARQYSQQFMEEPYTLNLIKQSETLKKEDQEQADIQLVKKTLREMMSRGNYAAKVNAAARMAAILGIEAPSKSEQTITHQGGVMAVPEMQDLNSWEKNAMASQKALVKDTQE